MAGLCQLWLSQLPHTQVAGKEEGRTVTQEGTFDKYFHALWHFETVSKSEKSGKCQGFLGEVDGKAGKFSWPAN